MPGEEDQVLGRVEYGHFYKWLTSIGLALIAASVVVPWFLHQASDALIVSEAELADLTPTARRVLEQRQLDLEFIQSLQPWIFFFLVTLGILTTYLGLLEWKVRQDKIDQGEDFDLETKRLKFEQLTAAEEDDKIRTEAEEEGDDGATPTGEGNPSDPDEPQVPGPMALRVAELRDLEARSADLLSRAFSTTHRVTSHVRVKTEVGMQVQIDAVAVSEDNTWGTFVQDTVRIINANNARLRVRESLLRLAYASFDLARTALPSPEGPVTMKSAGLLLLVVDTDLTERVSQALMDESRQINFVLRRPVAVVTLTRTEFDTLSAADFAQLVSRALRSPQGI